MSDGGFTPRQRARGRRDYLTFQIFNVVSFTMLSGSVLTLFSLKLGAGSFFVGMLSALVNFGFLMMIAGRLTVARLGARKQWGLSWLFRNLSMAPILFAPIASAAGETTLALLLIFVPFFGFNFFKGTGLVGVNPMVGALSAGKDRGSFLARSQINVHIILIATNLFMAYFLGSEAQTGRYLILLGGGIGIGMISTAFLFRLPDPKLDTEGSENTLIASIRKGIKRSEFKSFITLASMMALIMGMGNPFLVVYAKRVYGLADNFVVLFLVVGNVGVIAMGLIARRLIDRLGGKPLYLIFLGTLCASVVMLIVSPNLRPISSYIYLAVLFFVYNFGHLGGANSAQNYFYTITDVNEQLNLGLLNSALSGTAGAAGSILGGVLLGILETAAGPDVAPVGPFRVFYAVILVLLLFCFPVLLKLKNDGQYSVRTALEVFLSRKNLRAVALLHKLDTSKTAGEEVQIIDSLAESNSPVVVQDLLDKLTSPRFHIRSRALRALENLPLTGRVADALITQVKRHEFTTGAIAARIMGRRNLRQGVPVLRKALATDDYLLQAEATLALARLGDTQSIPKIESILVTSSIPLVQIFAASALDILGSSNSLPYLFEALRREDSAPYFRDEIILSAADLIGIGDWFYPIYSTFLEKTRAGTAELIDFMADCGLDSQAIDRNSNILELLRSDRQAFGEAISARISERHEDRFPFVSTIAAAAGDRRLLRLDRFAFFLAAVLVRLECGWKTGD
jgi:HEAT repeat protein